MLKLSKVINEETKEIVFANEAQRELFEREGFEDMDVEEAYNGSWYVKGYAPEKPAMTYEEVRLARIEYRKNTIDNETNKRTRKIARNEWTDEDEEKYLAYDEEVTKYIELYLPYPVEA